MNEMIVGAGAPLSGAQAIDRRAEDRWAGTPVRRVSLAMSGIVLASLAIHVSLILAALIFTPADPVAPKEITVELVQEPEKPLPKPPDTAKATGPKGEPAKNEPAKDQPAKDQPAKDQPAKDQPVKDQPVKPEAKAEEPKPKPEESKPEPIQPEPPKAEAQVQKPVERPREPDVLAEKQKALDTLKQELDSLKAEQAALHEQAASEQAAAEQAAQPSPQEPQTGASGPMMANGKIGPIPPSFGAVALPALSEIDGEATGYQQIVFSQLARAKGIRRHMGTPGTAGVVFSIDADGKLVEARIAQPSGSDALDKEALEVVKAAQPFPKPPPGAQRVFSANFNFVPQTAP